MRKRYVWPFSFFGILKSPKDLFMESVGGSKTLCVGGTSRISGLATRGLVQK